MKITKGQLKGWSACKDVYEWFLRRFPEGEAEYQDVLNSLAEDDRPEYACWLMDIVGPDYGSVLEIDDINGCNHLFFAGRIIVKNSLVITGRLRSGLSIKAGKDIKAGLGIEAGLRIEAGGDIDSGGWIKCGADIDSVGWIKSGAGIKAGLGIEAGEGIKAGDEFGIFAGLQVRLTYWPFFAKVIAKEKPDNLISGFWAGPFASGARGAPPVTTMGRTPAANRTRAST